MSSGTYYFCDNCEIVAPDFEVEDFKKSTWLQVTWIWSEKRVYDFCKPECFDEYLKTGKLEAERFELLGVPENKEPVA